MTQPAHVSSLIDRRIEEYLSGPPDELQEAARRHRALPVYADIAGTRFLKPNGAVLFQGSDHAGSDLTPEQSPHWQLVARLAAAERFPELSDLVPIRPPSVPDCPDCEGKGRVLNDMLRCDACYGLGWGPIAL
jgi:hypothetical protein